jgi:hypothetical protein
LPAKHAAGVAALLIATIGDGRFRDRTKTRRQGRRVQAHQLADAT